MKHFVHLVIILLLTPLTFIAQEGGQLAPNASGKSASKFSMALGLKMSSFGPGLELVGGLSEKFNLRLGYNYFTFDDTDKPNPEWPVIATTTYELNAVSLIVDYQAARIFHVSGGVFFNMSSSYSHGIVTEDIYIGEILASPEQVGHIDIKITPNLFTPYIGVGLGRTMPRAKRVAFNLELGVMYHGTPKVEMTATGMITKTASRDQEIIMEHNLAAWDYYVYGLAQLSIKLF